MSTSLLTFGNKILTVGGNALSISSVDPYNPLGLPDYTMRLRYADGVTPTFSWGGSAVQVSSGAGANIWDFTYQNPTWLSVFRDHTNLVEVLGANTRLVTKMSYTFFKCTSLTTLPLFDISNVTEMNSTFSRCSSLVTVPLFDTSSVQTFGLTFEMCSSLTAIPLFNTSSASGMDKMFVDCTQVESGAFALYQQASSQPNPPTMHNGTFYNCGTGTSSGTAELAQIPSDWKNYPY